MIARLYEIGAKLRARIVTNSVTNLMGNRGQSRANCHQFCYQTEGTSGHSRAMESSLLGNGGKRRAIQGNASLGLITQRSKVQILPPQPTDYTAVILKTPFNLTFQRSPKSLKLNDRIGDSSLGSPLAAIINAHSHLEPLKWSKWPIVTKSVTNSARIPRRWHAHQSTIR